MKMPEMNMNNMLKLGAAVLAGLLLWNMCSCSTAVNKESVVVAPAPAPVVVEEVIETPVEEVKEVATPAVIEVAPVVEETVVPVNEVTTPDPSDDTEEITE